MHLKTDTTAASNLNASGNQMTVEQGHRILHRVAYLHMYTVEDTELGHVMMRQTRVETACSPTQMIGLWACLVSAFQPADALVVRKLLPSRLDSMPTYQSTGMQANTLYRPALQG